MKTIIPALAILLLFSCSKKSSNYLTAEVELGPLDINVVAAGELRAKKDIKVNAPFELRGIGIYNAKIQTIVPEGKVVKQGDVIVTLDRSELMNKINEAQNSVDKFTSEYTNARLDTTLNLREARDALANHLFSIEEKKLIWEQSEFEVPSIRKQAELNYEKAKTAYERQAQNYITKQKQAEAKMQIVGSDLAGARAKLQKLIDVMDKLNIQAPEDGMVIYAKEWDGRKRVAGSTFNIWNPKVASLPDLRYMESVTQVNEVDIRKVKVGQTVKISLDSDPDKKLNGTVRTVANIGEKKSNSDAKVFEVVIDIEGSDTTLRPAMSTRNEIVSEQLEESLIVPLEALNSNDSLSFVYKRSGGSVKKVEVETGKSNSTHIQVLNGLKEGETVLLNSPDNAEDLPLEELSKDE